MDIGLVVGGRCGLQGRLDAYECNCTFGWRGQNCEQVDNCANSPCSNGAVCTSTPNGKYSGMIELCFFTSSVLESINIAVYSLCFILNTQGI